MSISRADAGVGVDDLALLLPDGRVQRPGERQPTAPAAPTAPVAPPIDDGPSAFYRAFVAEQLAHRRRKRSIRRGKAVIVVLAAALLVPWLLEPPQGAAGENRTAVSFPGLGPEGLVNGSTYRQTDAALRDRLALRDYVVAAVAEAARDHLGASLSTEVVLGTDGTPFTAEDFTMPCDHPFDAAAVDTALAELAAAGAATGKSVMVAVAPDKSSVMPEKLGRRGPALLTCADRVKQATEQEWKGVRDAPVLTVWDEVREAERADPGRVFQPGDTHWTSQGALVFSKRLIQRLVERGEAPRVLNGTPSATPLPDVQVEADLFRMLGTPKTESIPVWHVKRTGITLNRDKVDTPSGRGMTVYRTLSRTDEPVVPGRTLVVHDSFFSRAQTQLAPYFAQMTAIHWSDFLSAVTAGTVPHYDRLIIQTSQRGWAERSNFLLQGSAVRAAIQRELATPKGSSGGGGRVEARTGS